MDTQSTEQTSEVLTEEEIHHLQFADDPEYWDYLDQLDYELGGAREWDMPVEGDSR